MPEVSQAKLADSLREVATACPEEQAAHLLKNFWVQEDRRDRWAYRHDKKTIVVRAFTKGEARAELKRLLGLETMPAGSLVERQN